LRGAGEATDLPAALRPLAAEPGRSALFLDFDGTLASIVADPTQARPLPGVPSLLAGLARTFALVAVLSGRPTAFLEEVLGAPPNVTLAGLYGLDRALRGPERAKWAKVIDEVVAEARATAPEGVYVEPKGLTVTLHWRRAPDCHDWVVAFAERQRAERGLAVSEARTERELRPPLHVDKGTLVRSLVAEHAGRLRAMAVFGDDVGDLPAFAAAEALTSPEGGPESGPLTAVTVAAVDTESPPALAARADLTVDGPLGAVALLRQLAEAASAPPADTADPPDPQP
jgi:trehalose 6-phosphate phosphatase